MPSRSQRHLTQVGRVTSGGVQPITLGIYFTGFQAPENVASGATLGTLSTQGTTGTPVFALTNTDGSRVALSGANVVRGATAWDFETHPLVTFTVSVSGVTPTITPTSFQMICSNVLETVLNALTLSANTIPENSPLNTVVGAIQNKTAGSTLTLIDNGNERFAISGTNLVTSSIPTDYETATSHSITIRETHPDAAPRDTSFTINVTNVLEGNLNALTLNNNAVNENMAIGTVVGTLQGKTSGSTLALNLTGAAVGKFTLSGTDILTAAVLDYEAATSYSISITETLAEAANSPRVTPLTINVGDVFEGTDSTPNAFTFTDQTGVALSTPITSNTITVSGIDLPSPLTITGGTYSVNGGAFVSTPTTVNNGDTVAVRVTSSGSFSTAANATLTIGGVSDTFTVTTLAIDTVPDAFTFTDQTGVALSTPITSNTITVSGINSPSPLTITGGTYSINGGAFASAATNVNNGDTVAVRVTSSGTNATAVNATLTIGGVVDTFTATTLAAGGSDSVPNAFTFTDQTNVGLSTLVTSNTITVSGIDIPANLTITGGQYSINGGAFASAATTVNNGDTVAVRTTSSGSPLTPVNVVLTIGGVADTFTVTTVAFGPFTLAWTSATTELTNLAFSITPSLNVGDVVVLTLSVNSNMSSPFATSAANTIDSSEAAAGSLTFTGITTPLSTGLTYARVNVVRGALNADSSTAPITLVGASAAPWNSADKVASVNLTGSNYIATLASNGFAGVRILGAKSAGKVHVEFRLPVMSGASSFGVANIAQSLTTYVGDVGSSSIGIFSTGLVWANNVSQSGNGIAGGFVANAWCAIEIDFSTGALVFMDSAGTKGTVYSLSLMGNGPYYLMWSSNLTGHSVEINSGQSAFLITPSSGYVGWSPPTDTTAPFLTAATGTKTGSSTATLTVSTDEANGRVYGVASAAVPSQLQIRRGLSSTGAASTYAFDQLVSATGVQTKNATGLAGATSYTMHYMHEDTTGNLSNVASASAFTTDAATGWTSPLDASTPAVWWIDASNAGSVTHDGLGPDLVQQINDLGAGTPSGTKHNLTSTGARTGPEYLLNALNSKSGLSFIPGSDGLKTTSFTIPQPFMLVIVWKQSASAPSSFGILWDGDITVAAATRASVFNRHDGISGHYIIYGGTVVDQGVTTVINTAYHSRAIFNGASSSSVLNASTVTGAAGSGGVVNGIVLSPSSNGSFAIICEAFIIKYVDAADVTAKAGIDATNAAAYTLAKWGV